LGRPIYVQPDLIDLAMLTPSRTLLNGATGKAATAYENAIERCLSSAIEYLADNPRRLGECMGALQMFDTPEAVLWQHITRLGR
jgi:hypothetical protein